MLRYVIISLSFVLVANATHHAYKNEAVCGSNLETYNNQKELECVAKCTKNTNLVVAGRGSCLDPCNCSKIYKPVCANNGKTYFNLCRFNCALQRDPRLAIILKSACPRCLKPVSKFKPVCGTDGNTYFNRFILDHIKKLINPKLCLESTGVCPCFCPAVFIPVCSNTGVTYGNICELECARKINPKLRVLYEGVCTKTCNCSLEFNLVCGNDGNTYTNKCILDCTKKNSFSNLAFESLGPCPGQ